MLQKNLSWIGKIIITKLFIKTDKNNIGARYHISTFCSECCIKRRKIRSANMSRWASQTFDCLGSKHGIVSEPVAREYTTPGLNPYIIHIPWHLFSPYCRRTIPIRQKKLFVHTPPAHTRTLAAMKRAGYLTGPAAVPKAPLPFTLPSRKREGSAPVADGHIGVAGAKWASQAPAHASPGVNASSQKHQQPSQKIGGRGPGAPSDSCSRVSSSQSPPSSASPTSSSAGIDPKSLAAPSSSAERTPLAWNIAVANSGAKNGSPPSSTSDRVDWADDDNSAVSATPLSEALPEVVLSPCPREEIRKPVVRKSQDHRASAQNLQQGVAVQNVNYEGRRRIGRAPPDPAEYASSIASPEPAPTSTSSNASEKADQEPSQALEATNVGGTEEIDIETVQRQHDLMKRKAEDAAERRKAYDLEQQRQRERAVQKLKELEARLSSREAIEKTETVNAEPNSALSSASSAGSTASACGTPKILLRRDFVDKSHSNPSEDVTSPFSKLSDADIGKKIADLRAHVPTTSQSHVSKRPIGPPSGRKDGRCRRDSAPRDLDGPAPNESREQWLDRRRKKTEPREAARYIIEICINRAVKKKSSPSVRFGGNQTRSPHGKPRVVSATSDSNPSTRSNKSHNITSVSSAVSVPVSSNPWQHRKQEVGSGVSTDESGVGRTGWTPLTPHPVFQGDSTVHMSRPGRIVSCDNRCSPLAEVNDSGRTIAGASSDPKQKKSGRKRGGRVERQKKERKEARAAAQSAATAAMSSDNDASIADVDDTKSFILGASPTLQTHLGTSSVDVPVPPSVPKVTPNRPSTAWDTRSRAAPPTTFDDISRAFANHPTTIPLAGTPLVPAVPGVKSAWSPGAPARNWGNENSVASGLSSTGPWSVTPPDPSSNANGTSTKTVWSAGSNVADLSFTPRQPLSFTSTTLGDWSRINPGETTSELTSDKVDKGMLPSRHSHQPWQSVAVEGEPGFSPQANNSSNLNAWNGGRTSLSASPVPTWNLVGHSTQDAWTVNTSMAAENVDSSSDFAGDVAQLVGISTLSIDGDVNQSEKQERSGHKGGPFGSKGSRRPQQRSSGRKRGGATRETVVNRADRNGDDVATVDRDPEVPDDNSVPRAPAGARRGPRRVKSRGFTKTHTSGTDVGNIEESNSPVNIGQNNCLEPVRPNARRDAGRRRGRGRGGASRPGRGGRNSEAAISPPKGESSGAASSSPLANNASTSRI